jgi:LacI family transcriptional regulator
MRKRNPAPTVEPKENVDMSTDTSTPRQSAVGLRDIAKELNVSVSLVSKVLSGRLGTTVANAKKMRAIHDKARELGYQKNVLAEALRTGRQNVLALFLHRHGEPGSGIVDEMIAGVAEEANRMQQRLAIHFYQTQDEFKAFLPRMHRNAVDGVIVGGLPHNEIVDDLRVMHERSIPIVTIHDVELDAMLPNVGMDQREVTRLATHHLIDRGCRAIAHFRVASSVTELPVSRFNGYRMALEERGLAYRPELVIDVRDFGYDTGIHAIQSLVRAGHRFDGVVGQSDQHGLASINYLMSEAGLNVPRDVKVTGVDNAPFCRYGAVQLTSVSQEFLARGRRAAELLMKKLDGQEVTSERIAPALSVRASTGG